jgi:hypothetical protein
MVTSGRSAAVVSAWDSPPVVAALVVVGAGAVVAGGGVQAASTETARTRTRAILRNLRMFIHFSPSILSVVGRDLDSFSPTKERKKTEYQDFDPNIFDKIKTGIRTF